MRIISWSVLVIAAAIAKSKLNPSVLLVATCVARTDSRTKPKTQSYKIKLSHTKEENSKSAMVG
jgi:hypothetical protein